MRCIRLAAVFAGLFFHGLVPERLLAQTATQTVTFSVMPTSRTIVSGTARPIIVRTTTAGRVPISASDGGSSYAITTNESNQKISASLDAPMPHGVVLAVSLAAPVQKHSTSNACGQKNDGDSSANPQWRLNRDVDEKA